MPAANREITIVSHCTLFYWWPVWAVGFTLAFLSWISPERMLLVDKHTAPGKAAEAVALGAAVKDRDAWILPEKATIGPDEKLLHVAKDKNAGVLFCIVLLLVIAITNVPLRGLWSVIVILLILIASIILALYDAWKPLLEAVNLLDIRINLGGYLLISTTLFLLWLIVLAFFDHQIYMTFAPGSLRVVDEIGAAVVAMTTIGMVVHKQRSDLFRHWFLGLGSGDLIVKTASGQHYEMQNVLFISAKLRAIQRMLPEIQAV